MTKSVEGKPQFDKHMDVVFLFAYAFYQIRVKSDDVGNTPSPGRGEPLHPLVITAPPDLV